MNTGSAPPSPESYPHFSSEDWFRMVTNGIIILAARNGESPADLIENLAQEMKETMGASDFATP